MRFQVPQFIETESKSVGPFTLKQFLYIAAGAVLIFIFRYTVNSFFIWLVMSLPVALLAAALAFYKIDGVPLPRYLIMAFSFLTGAKKYIYRRRDSTADILPGGDSQDKNG